MSNIADSNNEPPPVPPAVIPSIVDTLDPDLAMAYRSGNAMVIQAVNSGMTTSGMIVNELIRTGASMAGMPPGVQSLVTDRRKEMEEQAEAERARLAKLAAAVVGMGMMATNIAQGGQYYGGEGNAPRNYSTNPPSGQEFAGMGEGERSAYYQGIRAMSVEDWSAAPQATRDQHIANVSTGAQDGLNKASDAYSVVEEMQADTRLGATETERLKSMAKLQGHATDWLAANPGKNLEDYADHLLCSKHDLSPVEMRYAVKFAAADKGWDTAKEGVAAADRARDAEDRKDPAGSKAEVDTAIDRINKLAETMRAPEAIQAKKGHLFGSDRAMDSVKTEVGAAPADVDGGLRAAGKNNLAAGAGVDEAVAKADKKAQLEDGGFEEEAPQLASAPPRLTINAQPLAAAGQLQPEGVVAANDPKGPAPEQERPRVAAASQGMGGMGGAG